MTLRLQGRRDLALAVEFIQALKDVSFSGSLKVFVALEPGDMRKGFNGLEALVADRLKECPQSGALFLFSNKKRNRLKVLYFDGTGLWVLEAPGNGRFSWPKPGGGDRVKLRLRPGGLRLAVRASESAPIVQRIQRALFKLSPRCICPRATWAKPSPTRWTNGPASELYLRNGAIEIDNNLVDKARQREDGNALRSG